MSTLIEDGVSYGVTPTYAARPASLILNEPTAAGAAGALVKQNRPGEILDVAYMAPIFFQAATFSVY